MDLKTEYILVSAFGRGQWLAAELARQGFDVSLVDVSGSLGHWTPEDWEGPFGFFHSERLSPHQVERLVEDDPPLSVDAGFTLLLEDGPLELQSGLTPFLLKKKDVSAETEDYLFEYDSDNEEIRRATREQLKLQPFSKNWLAHLAHQMASNTFQENSQGLSSGRPLSVFSSFFIRQATRQGYNRSLEWCRSHGVKVLKNAKVIDFSVQRRTIEGVEVVSQSSGLLRGKNLIWMLSSEETQAFGPRVFNRLFPKGALIPEWCWVRYRVDMKPCYERDILPKHFVMLHDRGLPWSHENLCIVQRTVKEEDFDMWVRIPNIQRFQPAYLEKVCHKMISKLNERMHGVEAQCVEMPQEYRYTYEELGATRFPIYDKKKLRAFRRSQFQNVIFDGPEKWDLLDWEGQMHYQETVLNRIRMDRERDLREREEREL